jgi:hypothetical protein
MADGGASMPYHKVLTRTTYIGRHRFNTKFWKTRQRKPENEIVEMAVPAIVDKEEFEVVQMLLKSRSPAMIAPRVVSGPTLLTGICFCAACGGAMTLRTGKSGRYRYYTCCTKARQSLDYLEAANARAHFPERISPSVTFSPWTPQWVFASLPYSSG